MMVQEPPGGDVGGDETPFPSLQMISGKGNSCRAGLCHYSNYEAWLRGEADQLDLGLTAFADCVVLG